MELYRLFLSIVPLQLVEKELPYEKYAYDSNKVSESGTWRPKGKGTVYFFRGFRYAGTTEIPSEVANAIFFVGSESSLAKDADTIESIMANLEVQPRYIAEMKRISHSAAGFSFEIPAGWITAPVHGRYGEVQAIASGGDFLYTEQMEAVDLVRAEEYLRKGHLSLYDHDIKESREWKGKSGMTVKVLSGGVRGPFSKNLHDQLTVVVFPISHSKSVGLIVILGSLFGPAELESFIDSIRISEP